MNTAAVNLLVQASVESSLWDNDLRVKLQGLQLGPGLACWLSGEESACNAGDTGEVPLIPGLGRCPGGGHGNPLQYSCLESPMDRGAWRATVHGATKSQM